MTARIWPLFDLQVSTPRVMLRYVTDELGEQLAELAAKGIHDPATMPFSEPWTDVEPPELQRNALRYFWRSRADTTAQHWTLTFAAHDHQGQLIGQCSLNADHFPATRTATTGSWIGRQYQGRGLGREIRHAALHLIFAGLQGEKATTRAWHDNAASIAVTRSLPYTDGAAVEEPRRGRLDTMLTFSMTLQSWLTICRSDVEIAGISSAVDFLGIATQPRA